MGRNLHPFLKEPPEEPSLESLRADLNRVETKLKAALSISSAELVKGLATAELGKGISLDHDIIGDDKSSHKAHRKRALERIETAAHLRATMAHYYQYEPYDPIVLFTPDGTGKETVTEIYEMWGEDTGESLSHYSEFMIMENLEACRDDSGDIVRIRKRYHRDEDDPFVKPLTFCKKEQFYGAA